MLRDNLVELIEPMLNSVAANPLALCIPNRTQTSNNRLPCLKNPRPVGAESNFNYNVAMTMIEQEHRSDVRPNC
jgi:hypothetical protein